MLPREVFFEDFFFCISFDIYRLKRRVTIILSPFERAKCGQPLDTYNIVLAPLENFLETLEVFFYSKLRLGGESWDIARSRISEF